MTDKNSLRFAVSTDAGADIHRKLSGELSASSASAIF
jgi:hypothetical protein